MTCLKLASKAAVETALSRRHWGVGRDSAARGFRASGAPIAGAGRARSSRLARRYDPAGAFVRSLRYTVAMDSMGSPAPWDLLERLDAASIDAQMVHHDLCTVFRDDEPCSCGYPQLLIDAAEFVRSLAAESVVTQAQRAA
jgi:hypothetical protein